MLKRQKILVAMPTHSHAERMKLEGILKYAHEKKGAHWDLVLDLSGILKRLARTSTRSPYDGIIAYVGSDAERKTLLTIRQPLVLIEDQTLPKSFPRRKNIVTLLCDHESEGETAANYFLGRNYRNFAYVGDEGASEYSALRLRGYRTAVSKAGFHVTAYDGAAPLATWLKTLSRPCAVFAVHDLRARDVLTAAEQANIPVPGALAVLGVDNDDVLCTTSSPSLSSIPTFDRSLGYAAGRALNELLLGRAKGRTIRTRHTKVTTRHSTASEVVSDIFVAQALDWARDHLGEKLTADKLAEHAHCSKPYLQEHAGLSLGITLAAAIRRLRLTTAAELLLTTELPVSEISARCGFACVSHFAVLMKDAYGLTPLAYRKHTCSPSE